MKSTRREFLKQALGVCAGAGLLSRLPERAFGKEKPWPDLVAVKGASPVQLFEAGIRALGGMGRFVKKGQAVLVKPNIGWSKTPSEAACTNPDLVAKVVAQALRAGAKDVFVFDHSVNVEKECYERSGIEAAVRAAGGKMRSAEKESSYRKVKIPGGKVLAEALVHELYLDCDVVINVPILKNHGGGRMTGCMKNLMGVVWDRRFYHRNGLMECIAEFPLVRKPDLNILDAYLVMTKNGPRGLSTEDLALKKMQLLSADLVLADTAATKVLDMEPGQVPYLKMAADLKLGSMDMDKAKIERVSLGS
ncbi:MAG: DUF362 domain-containing protein [Elusimicrobiota bacterium]